ncbi:MAG: hypothetical protein ACE5EX_00170 [Phycisphaerae bacterium]
MRIFVKSLPLVMVIVGGIVAWTRTSANVAFNRDRIGRVEITLKERLDRIEGKLDRLVENGGRTR